MSMLRPVFIGGCDRSGTTFLAAEIARRTGVVALPESSFISETALRALDGEETPAGTAAFIADHYRYRPWRAAGAGEPAEAMGADGDARARLDRLVAAYVEATRAGPASVFVEHSPQNRTLSPRLTAVWPDLRLLHIVRDGRAVAASLTPLDWGPNTIVGAAHFWAKSVADGLAAVEAFGPARAMTVRYERLVEAPDEAFGEILTFLGLDDRPERPDGPAFLRPGYAAGTHAHVGAAPRRDRAESWRERLSPRQVELFELTAGDTLDSLGYRCICDRNRIAPPGAIEKGALKAVDFYRRRRNEARYRRRHQQVM